MDYGEITVTTANTKIISANEQRKILTLCNISNSITVYIGPDASVTTSNGIPLYENQTRDSTKTFGYYLGAFYGMARGGTANVRYWEVT